MLVVLIENQLLAPKQVCQSCLLANQDGQPRWQQGQLCCGHPLEQTNPQQPHLYECQMGFQIANIE